MSGVADAADGATRPESMRVAPLRSRQRLLRACGAAAVLLAIAIGSIAGAGEDAQPSAVAWGPEDLALRFPDPDAGTAPDAYSGTARCVDCHAERDESLGTSFHASLRDDALGCEQCHGAGAAHSESDGLDPIRHPWDVPPVEMIGVCLTCHADVLTEPVRGHRDWIADGTGQPRSCATCHEVHVDRASPEHAADTGPFRDIAALAEVAEPIPASRCIACHPTFHPQMARSGHSDLLTDGAQCATCHGNGSLHERSGGRAALIVNPARQRPRDANRTCNSCHGSGAIVQRFTCSEHGKEGTSCITCHDANAPRGRTLRAPEFELCGSCHLDVKASFRLPNGHKVARGRVLCSDCHDPHDNPRRVRDRDVRMRSCAKCHEDKVGPFVHDHGIKRTEGCIACHAPHGSVNDRLLTFRRMKPQCLQCHPETPHDLSASRYDNCIACHVEIHGSDVDRLFRR